MVGGSIRLHFTIKKMEVKKIFKERPKMFVLRNCTFVEALTEGTRLKAGDILMKDGKIERIESCGTAFEGELELLPCAM
jgi:hypothetical protein